MCRHAPTSRIAAMSKQSPMPATAVSPPHAFRDSFCFQPSTPILLSHPSATKPAPPDADAVPTVMRLLGMLPYPVAPKSPPRRCAGLHAAVGPAARRPAAPKPPPRRCTGLHAAVGPAARRPGTGGPCVSLRRPVSHLHPAALHHPGRLRATCVFGRGGREAVLFVGVCCFPGLIATCLV